MLEGTRYTTSSTNDRDEAIKNVEKMQMAVRQMKEKEHFLNHFFDARI